MIKGFLRSVPRDPDNQSESVRVIINERPVFFERWGLVMFLIFLCFLLASTWFVKIHNTIQVDALVENKEAPLEVVCNRSGRLIKLLVHPDDEIEHNQVVGWFESLADHEQVMGLSRELDSMKYLIVSRKTPNLKGRFRDKYKNLGELTKSYRHFIMTLREPGHFESAIENMKDALNRWCKRYIIISPGKGKILFNIPLEEGILLRDGMCIAYILPDSISYYACLYIPQDEIGKIKIGSLAQLSFDGHFFQDVGPISGYLSHISGRANPNFFLATMQFTPSLGSRQQRSMQLAEGLKGKAIIVTQDVRLLLRLYDNIVNRLPDSAKS